MRNEIQLLLLFREKIYKWISGKKLEDICPSTHNMEVPNVKRKDYQLIGMDDDFLSLMDDSGDTRDDLKCPAEDDAVGKEVRDAISNEADILVSSRELWTMITSYFI